MRVFLIGALVFLSGCSTQAWYGIAAGQASYNCRELKSADERDRCKKASDLSFEQYEKERRKVKVQ